MHLEEDPYEPVGLINEYFDHLAAQLNQSLSLKEQKKILEKEILSFIPRRERIKVTVEAKRIFCYIENRERWMFIIKVGKPCSQKRGTNSTPKPVNAAQFDSILKESEPTSIS